MNKLIKNFNNCDVIFDESSIFFNNGFFECSLLFEPNEILSVTNYNKTISYPVNDFEIKGCKLIYKSDEIINLSKEEYEGMDGDPFDLSEMKRFRIKRPYYSETYLQKKQLLISYIPKKTTDYFSLFDNSQLTQIKEKLSKKQNIKIVIYGDSICRGMTSSGYLKREPFIPPWYELVKLGIEEKFGNIVEIFNDSEIGMDALWGVNNMQQKVPLDADLYIIGFGMNDGTGGVDEKFYIQNISKIVDYIGNDKDIILMSTIIPNPDAELIDGTKFLNKQENYYPYLKELESNNICVANFTKLHKNILLKKNYCDISGNNINHPNDFLGRCMAIGILRMLGIKE